MNTEAAGNHPGNEWLPAYSGIRGPLSVRWGRLSGENRGMKLPGCWGKVSSPRSPSKGENAISYSLEMGCYESLKMGADRLLSCTQA